MTRAVLTRILITFAIFGVIIGVILLLGYEVIGVKFDSFMEFQLSAGYLEAPLLLPPADSVPLSQPDYMLGTTNPPNPVIADGVSLQRGAILFNVTCAVCHGPKGAGDGPVVRFWKQDQVKPFDLTQAAYGQLPDGAIYNFVTKGIANMPEMREHLTERDRWDVINFLRTLQH